jgi:hypothetical protein
MRHPSRCHGGGRAWRAGILALAIALSVAACGGETYPEPGYKPPAPVSAGNNQPIKTAMLSGNVYIAESPTLLADTQLPEGYKLLPGEEGRVTVRIPGTPAQTRAVAIKDGAYEVPDLPLGVTLDVTATYPGYVSRRQQVVIVLTAGRRLNFDHDPDGAGSYLIPLKDPPH